MAVFKRAQVINKPVDVVFQTVVDVANFPNWNPTTPSARKLSNGEIGNGTRFELEIRGLGKVQQELREFDRNKQVRLVPSFKLLSGGHRFIFTAEGAKTRIDHELEMTPKGVFKIFIPHHGHDGQEEPARHRRCLAKIPGTNVKVGAQMSKQTMTTNGYFGPDLFRFLRDLKTHNERGWFEANKQRYKADVQAPFLRLITDLAPALKKIGGGFIADPSPNGGSMMRIYRDIRFSKDKSPYKTYAAAHFWQANREDGAAPAYFLHLEPGNSVIGGGVWQPEPKALKKIRDKIAGDPKGWGRATTGSALGSTCRMAGDSLKRPPAGYDPAHPFIEDIKRKDFAISTPLTDKEITGDDFLDLVLQRLRATAPFVQFLSNAVRLR